MSFFEDTATEMICFMVAGEEPSAETILGRLGEFGKCLVTGGTEELTILPVDLNTSNILPSNMAMMSRGLLDKTPLILDYSLILDTSLPIVVEFKTIHKLYKYNKDIVQNLSLHTVLEQKHIDFLASDGFDERFTGNILSHVFEKLISLHVKGISKVSIANIFSLDWASYQTSVVSLLEQNKKKSNIIRPNFGYN